MESGKSSVHIDNANRKANNGLIETHAHLDFPQYDGDRESVIERAFEAGVEAIINIGIDLETSRRSIELSERYPNIFATVAFHPHHASEMDDRGLKEIEGFTSHPKVVAIGEIGLDYYKNLSPRDAQIKVFRQQMELAVSMNLPIVVHIRDAHTEGLDILTEYIAKTDAASKLRGVLHCFSGDENDAWRSLDLGLLLAFNGTITYRNSMSFQVLKKLPLNAILTETDCPFLAPEPLRGKRNEPRLIRRVLEKMTEAHQGYSFEKIESITTENAKKLFSI